MQHSETQNVPSGHSTLGLQIRQKQTTNRTSNEWKEEIQPFNLQILLYYNRTKTITADDQILPSHHVKPTAYQAKDRVVHPLLTPEDWSMGHSRAEHSWPAKLTVAVLSMAAHQLPQLILGDQVAGQIVRSIRQTKWTGCDAHLSSKVWYRFPLKFNETPFQY